MPDPKSGELITTAVKSCAAAAVHHTKRQRSPVGLDRVPTGHTAAFSLCSPPACPTFVSVAGISGQADFGHTGKAKVKDSSARKIPHAPVGGGYRLKRGVLAPPRFTRPSTRCLRSPSKNSSGVAFLISTITDCKARAAHRPTSVERIRQKAVWRGDRP